MTRFRPILSFERRVRRFVRPLRGRFPVGEGGSAAIFFVERGFDASLAVDLRFEFACIALKYGCQMMRAHPCPGEALDGRAGEGGAC